MQVTNPLDPQQRATAADLLDEMIETIGGADADPAVLMDPHEQRARQLAWLRTAEQTMRALAEPEMPLGCVQQLRDMTDVVLAEDSELDDEEESLLSSLLAALDACVAEASGAWQSSLLQEMSQRIEQDGLAVQHVLGDATHVPYSYTVGLGRRQHPELLLIGLPAQVADTVLVTLGRRVVSGERIAAGDRVAGALANDVELHARLRAVDEPQLNVARAMNLPVVALQLLWPDAAGVYPGNLGCDPQIEALQS